MEEKKSLNKSVVVVSLLLLLVVAGLLVLFVMRPSEQREGIVLPGPQTELSQGQPVEPQAADNFLEINTENLVTALRSLQKPEYYHQVYAVTVSSGKYASTKTVELWVNGSWTHAEVSDDHSTKSIFTDGHEAWIWYTQDSTPVSVQLGENLLLEDLLGIPNFDYQVTMEQARLVSAGYDVQEGDFTPYIFAETEEVDSVTSQYRFALDSGLLLRCSVMEGELLVYEVVQTAFDRLAFGDQSFAGRFCLPDGTVPFTVETRMLQP